jgi:hypothetical protein
MTIKYLIFFIILIFLFSCKSERKYNQPVNINKVNISSTTLWLFITRDNNYKEFPMWPNFEGLQIGQSPHGRYHIIFIDPIMKNLLPIKERIVPYGSLIVKENFDADKNLSTITAMIKVKDFDPENNDWYWAKYDSKGNPQAEGKIDSCISCHIGKKDNDFIIVHPLDMKIDKKGN